MNIRNEVGPRFPHMITGRYLIVTASLLFNHAMSRERG